MSRFFIILSLVLNLYLVWCAAGVFMAMAHSGSEIMFPMEGLERGKDKNSPEFLKSLQETKEYLLERNDERGVKYTSLAIKIACVAALQFFVTLGLALAGAFRKPSRKEGGGSADPARS